MTSLKRRPIDVFTITVAFFALAGSVLAGESDLSVKVCGPTGVGLGQDLRLAVKYWNLGPDPAFYGYINIAIPSGLPARLDDLTDQQLADLVASFSDTHGNSVLVRLDPYACESLMLQIQGPDPPGPIHGLDPREKGGMASFRLPVPVDPPVFGRVVVVDPPRLAREFLPAFTRYHLYHNGGVPRYASGVNCNATFGGCTQLEDCFGPRLSLMGPLTAKLELVSGGGYQDPTTGCGHLVDFTPGRIALVRNGGCYFFEKAFYAQLAGAVGVVVVNNTNCGTLGPDSPDCVYRMNGGASAGMIEIPVVMVSSREGEELIAELDRGGSVTVSMGAIARRTFDVGAEIFSADQNESDPNPHNDGHSHGMTIGPFSDGFDCGGCLRWSDVFDR